MQEDNEMIRKRDNKPEYPLLEWAKQNRASAAGAPSNNATSTTGERLSRHPLSKAFGDLPPKSREALIAKVKQSGAVREIPTLDNQVLLDWEVYNVALDLGLPVQLRQFSGEDPLAFIIVSCRRQPQWDQGQRAVIAVRLHAWRERGRPGKSVLSTDLTPSESEPQSKTRVPASTAKIADSTQVSPTFITQAKRVEEFGLGEVVISGETVGVAAVRARPPTKAEMAKRVEELERENRRLADRAEATEARAAAAEAQVKRLTAMLESAPAAA